MTPEEHKARHLKLHDAMVELVEDYLNHHPQARLSLLGAKEVITWSGDQTRDPTVDDTAHLPATCSNCGQAINDLSIHVCSLEETAAMMEHDR